MQENYEKHKHSIGDVGGGRMCGIGNGNTAPDHLGE
jgi:hypothetical protein